MTPLSPPLWVMADVHGALAKLLVLLQQAGLTDASGTWTGGRAHLVFLGDYLDRGPDGVGVIRLIRRLEAQAQAAGGQVTALLGNHEVMFLAARRFTQRDPHDQYGFRDYWLANGGQPGDAAQLTPDEQRWLTARPALARAGRWLLLHADTPMYLHLGRSVDAVNIHVTRLLHSDSPEVWGHFANAFADRLAFLPPQGEQIARQLLSTFGGERLAHGHTPVPILLDEQGQDGAVGPLFCAGQLALALDGGLAYSENAGFITRLSARDVAEVVVYPGSGAADGRSTLSR
ncbi:metallophosphoesterase [Deinococcus geothermalis DSM 11300]|uniref:Metallophosphoesterase n=1 Tax=Deinococcus geothermalis (strain DSM 11300 / CIP 105573 / AG-3a) TaxID=319795 RepID=Q1IY40_DEIGD|nr:metallophosphoesterase [Deinococcus geothermalis]ABF45844.1 metallophosphoesterase [Deinococcus geothermalis DSM 11300]